MRLNHAVRLLPAFALLLARLSGQTVSGSVTGLVVDPSGAAVPDAVIQLINQKTGEPRSVRAFGAGEFTFSAVQPGEYTIRVSHPGFRSLEIKNNVLTAATRLDLGELKLDVGTATESVSVTAQASQVQTGGSENSALLTAKQLELIGTRGRDVTSLLRLLPGVAQGAEAETPGGPGYGNTLPNIMGRPANWSTASIDGLTGNDLGGAQFFSAPNMDSVGEVKVLLNSYQAEHGGNGGAIINMVTKSGTNQFHGTAYWYKRHEMFNANNFFNNSLGISKPRYRYTTVGATLGGPIPIPKLKDRLFFFYAVENWRIQNPVALLQRTMPLAEEREGNFSQTRDLNGALIPVRDPAAGGQVFPNNIIPASRLSSSGLAILRLFPMPNAMDRNVTRGNYNFNFQESIDLRKTQHVFRVDSRITEKDMLYVRGSIWLTNNIGYAVPANGPNFPLDRAFYAFNDSGMVVNHTRIISTNIVNEASVGVRLALESGGPADDEELRKISRSANGINFGQFSPQNNPLDIIPQMSFGGVTSAPSVAFDARFPIRGADTMTNINDTLSITRASHTFKAGAFLARGANGEGLRGRGNFSGSFAFGRDVNNPLDSNYAYSNSALGNFQSYTESSSRPQQKARIWYGAFFFQDTWKATRKLTLDLGVRVTWHTWFKQIDDNFAGFALTRFNPASAPQLFRPIQTPQGRRAVNPVTGEILPAVAIGALVPNTGNLNNGVVTAADRDYPAGLRANDRPLPEPRIGFSYDPFGDGRTAIRGGFGIFHQMMENGGNVSNLIFNPPIQFNPQVYYGTFNTLLGNTSYLFPGSTYAYDPNPKTPSVYNFSLGVQREVARSTVLGAAYVGSMGRFLQQVRQINTVAPGARFLPQNADPASPSVPLNDNFFRPFMGYANVTYNENASSSNYHSLQVTANRRFISGVQFALSYTYSKAMNYADADASGVAVYQPLRAWNYGKASFDQTHAFVLNYTWDLPAASKLVPHRLVRVTLDNWQFSGITTLASGMPMGIGFSTVDAADITGGGDGVRPNVTGRAQLAHGNRTFDRWFDPTVFARPARGDAGNAPKDVFRGPGFNNWDLFFFKNVPIQSERRYLQLRWEMYNAFNHTQYMGVDTGARFDAAGRQVNTRLGQVISTRTPRVMQASVRFTF